MFNGFLDRSEQIEHMFDSIPRYVVCDRRGGGLNSFLKRRFAAIMQSVGMTPECHGGDRDLRVGSSLHLR
jgi:hypothetical protein